MTKYPLIHPDFPRRMSLITPGGALDVDQIERAVHTMHEAGIVFGDLHPHNIVLRPDGEVRFLDLELASYAVDHAGSSLAALGYSAPDGRTGADTDLYAVSGVQSTAPCAVGVTVKPRLSTATAPLTATRTLPVGWLS